MCGIAGSISENNQVNENIVQCLYHRGPDDQTCLQEGKVILYHTRLAIQDICDGSQPMKLGEQLSIVFNGEIYNHKELRLKHKLKCSTRSDTETILHLYQKLGIAFLDELDGMFAIALLDNVKQQLWLIRDRAGKKPLYYFHQQNEWFFASELNVIKTTKNLQLHEEYFYEYLRLGSFYRSHTPYKNVFELPAGSWLRINLSNNTFEQKNWWSITPYYQKVLKIDEQAAIEQAEKYLHTAVKTRLESSDLEVGCFLSGGIDSSLVATTAAHYTNKIKTFTVAFPGKYNEAPLAKLVADKIGSVHTEINIDFSNLRSNIEEIISNYGEPFMDISAIPTWYVSQEAKKYVTVILNGDGADELFGGYRRYVPFSKYDFFATSSLVRGLAKTLHSMLPVSHDRMSLYNYIYRLTTLVHKNPLDVYLAASIDIFEGIPNHVFKNYSPGFWTGISEEIEGYVSSVSSGLRKLMLVDFNVSLPNQLLVKMDIGSMAHALEGRSPFLCKELLEWVPSLPDDFKINGKTTKYLLRQLAKNYVPPELINQPKRGFEIPLKQWLDGDLKEVIHSYLFSATAFFSSFVDKAFVNDLWDRKVKIGDEKRAKILWTLFSAEVWHKKAYFSC